MSICFLSTEKEEQMKLAQTMLFITLCKCAKFQIIFIKVLEFYRPKPKIPILVSKLSMWHDR